MIALPGPVLAVEGMGAVTAVGHSAAQTTASFIAHARRMTRKALDGLPDPVTIAECAAVTGGLSGAARLQALLPSAVVEALEGFDPRRDEPAPAGPTALEILVLPSWLDEAGRLAVERTLVSALEASAAWTALSRNRICLYSDSTGAWEALDLAHRELRRSPRLRDVLLAAVDSRCDPSALSEAALRGLLHHRGNGEGFVPGEAAACLRLTRAASVLSLAEGRFALHVPARTKAPAAFWPSPEAPDGAPLSQVLEYSLSAAGMDGSHISHLASDADGSAWRARMEALALGRGSLAEAGPKPHVRPAEILGQVGTPTGLLAWILPLQTDAHGVERANTVLGWGVDPEGSCAAAVLERSPI
jgi:3-oxoacyl-[acyl-carrier-protein] synthase-1